MSFVARRNSRVGKTYTQKPDDLRDKGENGVVHTRKMTDEDRARFAARKGQRFTK